MRGPYFKALICSILLLSPSLSSCDLLQGADIFARGRTCASVQITELGADGLGRAVDPMVYDLVCNNLEELAHWHPAFLDGLDSITFIPDLISLGEPAAGSYVGGTLKIESALQDDGAQLTQILIHELGHHWHESMYRSSAFEFTELSWRSDGLLDRWQRCGSVLSDASALDFIARDGVPISCFEDVAVSATAFFFKSDRYLQSTSGVLQQKFAFIQESMFGGRPFIDIAANQVSLSPPEYAQLSSIYEADTFFEAWLFEDSQEAHQLRLVQGEDGYLIIESRFDKKKGWSDLSNKELSARGSLKKASFDAPYLWLAEDCSHTNEQTTADLEYGEIPSVSEQCSINFLMLNIETGNSWSHSLAEEYTLTALASEETRLVAQLEGLSSSVFHHYLFLDSDGAEQPAPMPATDVFTQRYTQAFAKPDARRIAKGVATDWGLMLFPRSHPSWTVPILGVEGQGITLHSVAGTIMDDENLYSQSPGNKFYVLDKEAKWVAHYDPFTTEERRWQIEPSEQPTLEAKSFLVINDQIMVLESSGGVLTTRLASLP